MKEIIDGIECYRFATGVEGAKEVDEVIITNNALEMVKSIKEENKIGDDFFLRFATRGGGCSGMNYALGFDDQIEDEDRTYKVGDVNIVMDNKSLFYMMGVTLDYIAGDGGSGFVFNNPNNQKTCGCSH